MRQVSIMTGRIHAKMAGALVAVHTVRPPDLPSWLTAEPMSTAFTCPALLLPVPTGSITIAVYPYDAHYLLSALDTDCSFKCCHQAPVLYMRMGTFAMRCDADKHKQAHF